MQAKGADILHILTLQPLLSLHFHSQPQDIVLTWHGLQNQGLFGCNMSIVNFSHTTINIAHQTITPSPSSAISMLCWRSGYNYITISIWKIGAKQLKAGPAFWCSSPQPLTVYGNYLLLLLHPLVITIPVLDASATKFSQDKKKVRNQSRHARPPDAVVQASNLSMAIARVVYAMAFRVVFASTQVHRHRLASIDFTR